MRRSTMAIGLLVVSCNARCFALTGSRPHEETAGPGRAPSSAFNTGGGTRPAGASPKAGRTPAAPRALLPCDTARPTEGRAHPAIVLRAKPPKGLVHEEPLFHTCFARATDHAADGVPGFSRNDYSRRQAFNADSTRFLTTVADGHWMLYDANTFDLVDTARFGGDAEPQWHPTDPNVLFYGDANGGMKISAIDLRSTNPSLAIDLRGKLPWPRAARSWTKSEGSPSKDNRFWAFQVETDDFKILGFAVWDRTAQKLVGSVPTQERPDHVSMSPSGRWFVSSGDETIAWSPDFKTKKVLRKGGEHSDLAIGADGHDYYVSIDYQSNAGDVFMTDIDTGVRTDLFPTYIDHGASAIHFSGKAFDKPGWVLVSTYGGYGSKQWYMEKIFAMELAPNPRIYQLAAHHSAVDEYFAEPQATVNRDFTRIQFNSNWGVKGKADIDTYQIKLPAGAFP